ncbi:putative reverse transcriptase domain-containing protein [Tanacetum coccineum]
MCSDDSYPVMPRDSALAGCDRLVSEPLVIEKPTDYSISKDPEEEPIKEEPLEEPNEKGGSRGSFEVGVGAAEEGEVVCLVFQKNQKYEWGREQEEAFQTLKDNLCNTPILSLHDGPEDFVVYCDTSNQGLSCVLMQRGKKDIATYASNYLTYLKVNAETSKTFSSGYDANWVIVDRLTKSAYFLAIRGDYKMEKLARLYIDEIVAGHGVPVSIISDYDGRFTSRVLANITESLRDAIRYEYGLSSLDGWINYHSSIQCAPFEALYGRKCRSPVLWAEIGESRLIGPKLEQETNDKVVLIKEKLKAVRYRQKSYANNRRKLLKFEVEDRVLLKVSPWKAYRLRLPEELSSMHDTFHVSNLKKCLADANLHVPLDEIKVDKILRFVEEPVEIMDRELKSLKRSKISIVKVHWNSKRDPELMYECEDLMKARYP